MYYSISLYTKHYHAVNVLFKKDDPLKLDNNRPISVLNVDLKLLSYTLAQRLKKILPNLSTKTKPVILKNNGCYEQRWQYGVTSTTYKSLLIDISKG
jgi:hypothetical protein